MARLVSLPSAVLLRSQTDDRLLALARSGHERAFEAIVERYRRPLLRSCRRVLPEARAEDAVQQALVAAWTALERGVEVRELRPWLFRVAHNTALNQLRLSGYDHDELHDLLRPGPAPEEELERRVVVRATLAGIAALPERQRQALLRIAVEGRGQEEVARELGLSEGAVRQLVHRARVSLRAAATAVTPMPLAAWLADAGAGSAAGGVAATAAKVGTVAVLASGAATAPVLLEHGGARLPAAAAAQGATGPGRHAPSGRIAAAAAPVRPRMSVRSVPGTGAPGASRDERERDGRGSADAHRGGPGPRHGAHREDRAGPSGRGESGGEDRLRSSGSGESGGEDRAGPSGPDGSGGEDRVEMRSGGSGTSGGDDAHLAAPPAAIGSGSGGGSGDDPSSGSGGTSGTSGSDDAERLATGDSGSGSDSGGGSGDEGPSPYSP
jgi:RNA polymerase sigma factor (sigma-70 family)